MASKKVSFTKLKDWFTIQRIRVTNFIKEHKYTSSIVGLFALSCIVGLVVYATNDDQYAGKVTASGKFIIKDSSSSTDEDITSIKSFDTMVLDIPYRLSIENLPEGETVTRQRIIIEATFNEGVDASWYRADDDAVYEIDNANRKITAIIYNKRVNAYNNQKLYLKVNNVVNDTEIKVNIKIKESTAADFTDLGTKSVKVSSEKVDLSAKIVSGTAYKNADITNGRYAPFGVMVGFDKSVLKEENSLRGLYFDPNVILTMEATQSVNGASSQIELETKENYFGVYDRSKNLFDIPHYKFDSIQKSVYDSGTVKSLEKSKAGASGELNEVINPDLYLVGNKTINLTTKDTYTEHGVSLSEDGPEICKTTNSTCERVVKNESGEIVSGNWYRNPGKYTVTYKYSYSGGFVSASRTVNVTESEEPTTPSDEHTTVEVDGDTYSLIGDATIELEANEKYEDQGISQNGSKYEGEKLTITIENTEGQVSEGEEIDTSVPGTYKILYLISSDSGEDGILKRTVIVKAPETLTRIKSSTVKTNAIYMITSDTFTLPNITINDESVKCDTEHGCSAKFYNPSNNEEVSGVDPTKAGTYKVIYTVTDSNGFVIEVANTINIQIKYDLNISGIKTDGTYYTYGDFLVFGSYFVTARSVRDESVNSDISVNLRIGDEVSAPVINYEHAEGTKSTSLTLNDDSSGSLSEYKNTDYISYGEEVVLRSRFTYSADGDDDIKSLTVRVPINVANSTAVNPTAPFNMVEYYTGVEEANPYYINDEMKNAVSVKYYACEMDEASTGCGENVSAYGNYADYLEDAAKNSRLKLAYIDYSASNVKPGTQIDFRVRLTTSVGNQGGVVTLSSQATYDSKQTSSQTSINVTAFKARTKLMVNGGEYDAVINGANTSTSTWSIYPSVSMPAALVNTNTAGISELDYIILTVTLPKGINYVYNDNYDVPVILGNKLVYTLKGKKINEWIDPIYFDTSYDIDIKSGTKLDVTVEIQASSSKIVDSSSQALRTTTRSIIYQNNEIISYGMYTPYSAIPKNTAFDITTKLYNNSDTIQSNLDLVTLLPYNDVSNENNSFTGSYIISNVPENAMCTTALPSLISNVDKLLEGSEISWEPCSRHEDDNYAGVTAIRVNSISLESERIHEQNIKITPVGNKTDDVYEVIGYLLSGSEDERNVKSIGPLNVSVVSKKITGNVWEDFDANGIMDETEKKVEGVTLKLYNSETDELVTQTTSDEKGNYSLTDLEPGTYYVVAEYNTAKYGLSPYQVNFDKSITSSFTADTDESEVVDPSNPSGEENQGQQNQSDENQAETNPDEEDSEEPNDDETSSDETPTTNTPTVRTEDIEITNNTRTISNINLGLALRKVYAVKLNKYINKVITTNNLGVSTVKDYGNVSLAKLDVKDLNNLSIKVIYTLELENVGYYPGYIYSVRDYIPDGMSFNENYEENKGWVLNENGYLENNTLFDQIVEAGEKKYLTIAFDVSRKEAGSFINYAEVLDEDLQILVVAGEQNTGGE